MLTQREFGRQLIHMFMGFFIVTLIYFEIFTPIILFLCIIVGFLLSFICKYKRIPIISHFLDWFERDSATFPGKGMIFFFIGTLLVVELFPLKIALASVMVLAFGDSWSHIIGARIGKMKNIFNGHSKKLFEGTFAGTLFGFFGALLFVPVPEAFFGALGAMIAEVVEIQFNESELDDNIVVPLVAGTIMLIVSKLI
ncbi:hypothetical protein COV12_03125 [Candidatus Woesearchaeota archaeon CG10_big_fil_rev_8_21_14_0_10_32_24]|nr:MAG: hypothetical protein COV12_03125 [Candidatus Woesearchaeota archaeon CG10_big_fil_rev_8_21_14_0_10_32_24]